MQTNNHHFARMIVMEMIDVQMETTCRDVTVNATMTIADPDVSIRLNSEIF